MRLPTHLKRRLPRGSQAARTRALLSELGLATVCDEARCPNRVECFAHATATFLIMGPRCTRDCAFCSVQTGSPEPLDPGEPDRVAEAVRRLRLRHAVVTSVTRDDLPDGGAQHFAHVIRAIRAASPGTTVEVLVPDFGGDLEALDVVLAAAPDVLGHNVETVPRLCPVVRPQADFDRSLRLLAASAGATLAAAAGRHAERVKTKSGLMLGLGESAEEVTETLHALRAARVDLVAIGQYLQPTPRQVPVAEFIAPERFERHAAEARAMGFAHVAAGPFVRSSYQAHLALPA